MNVNVKLTMTDTERNQMYVNMTGKDVQTMVSRAQVNEFVRGAIDAIVIGGTLDEDDAPTHEATQLTAGERAEVDRLMEDGFCDSYIRGSIQVYRRLSKKDGGHTKKQGTTLVSNFKSTTVKEVK